MNLKVIDEHKHINLCPYPYRPNPACRILPTTSLIPHSTAQTIMYGIISQLVRLLDTTMIYLYIVACSL